MSDKQWTTETQMPDSWEELVIVFVNQLPQRMAEIGERTRMLDRQPWEAVFGETAHRLAHRLTGSAATFGLDEVSAAARGLEILVGRFKKSTVGPSAAEMLAIYAQLDQLIGVIDKHLPAA